MMIPWCGIKLGAMLAGFLCDRVIMRGVAGNGFRRTLCDAVLGLILIEVLYGFRVEIVEVTLILGAFPVGISTSWILEDYVELVETVAVRVSERFSRKQKLARSRK